jgi:hypothetical protein
MAFPLGGGRTNIMKIRHAGTVRSWGLPPLPAGIGQVEKFADVSGTPQGQFIEGGAFDPCLIGPGGVRMPAGH